MASVQIVWTFNMYQYMLPGGVDYGKPILDGRFGVIDVTWFKDPRYAIAHGLKSEKSAI